MKQWDPMLTAVHVIVKEIGRRSSAMQIHFFHCRGSCLRSALIRLFIIGSRIYQDKEIHTAQMDRHVLGSIKCIF